MNISFEYLIEYSELCQELRRNRKPCIEKLSSFFSNTQNAIDDSTPIHKIQSAIDNHLIQLLRLEKEIDYDEIRMALGMHELFPIGYAIRDIITPKQYWNLVGSSYMGGGLSKYKLEELIQIFNEPIPHRENLMSSEDLQKFKMLPHSIVIYRGCSEREAYSNQLRISWSLDKNVAVKFAKRTKQLYQIDSIVLEKTITKEKAVAFFSGRQEKEIIYLG
jgi:hypothetical protein